MDASVVVGGLTNVAFGDFSVIGGGRWNFIQTNAPYATVGGGRSNRIANSASDATISGGRSSTINTGAIYSVIAGGMSNRVESFSGFSVIGGGANNTASNAYATVPGGHLNVAGGQFSFASGFRAKAHHNGSIVWGDATNADIVSTTNNQATFRASGGFRIFSNTNATIGVTLAPNTSAWAPLCDREAKENFEPIDTAVILQQVAALPLSAWTYKHDPDKRRYIGPVAQDFQAAFGLGDNTTINTLDADGVAFAAIQALAEENERLRMELEAIKRHLGL